MWNFLISDVSKEMVCHIRHRERRALIQKASVVRVTVLFLLSHWGYLFYCIPILKSSHGFVINAG